MKWLMTILMTLAATLSWAGQWALIDVRTSGEYERSHIPGAVHIPYDEMARKIGDLGLAKNDEILLYCRSGRRADVALGILQEMGYTNVRNLGGEAEASAYFEKRQ
mgnify:CR=1 FL=1